MAEQLCLRETLNQQLQYITSLCEHAQPTLPGDIHIHNLMKTYIAVIHRRRFRRAQDVEESLQGILEATHLFSRTILEPLLTEKIILTAEMEHIVTEGCKFIELALRFGRQFLPVSEA